MDISPAWVSAGATVALGIGGILVRWVDNSITAIKGTQKLLFEKHDTHAREFQEHRLHVAETYVNREVLKEQLAPIHQTLEEIKDELREERKKP
jgi:phosphopantothenate synthetase